MTACPWPRRMSVRQMFQEILNRMETVMAAIDNLKAADDALKAEVTTALTDFANALANSGSANDPAIQQVADDMNALVTQIQGADPAAPPAPSAA